MFWVSGAELSHRREAGGSPQAINTLPSPAASAPDSAGGSDGAAFSVVSSAAVQRRE